MEAKKLNSDEAEFVEEICNKYKGLVRKIARNYFLQVGDEEDLIQEGMIGLYKAIYTYKKDKCSFLTFASICIKSQILNAIRAETAKKHNILNSGISFEQNNLSETFSSAENELEKLENFAEKEEMLKKIKSFLSKKENEVLDLYLDGLSYNQMAEILKTNTKSVENSIKRIREKLRSKQWNNI